MALGSPEEARSRNGTVVAATTPPQRGTACLTGTWTRTMMEVIGNFGKEVASFYFRMSLGSLCQNKRRWTLGRCAFLVQTPRFYGFVSGFKVATGPANVHGYVCVTRTKHVAGIYLVVTVHPAFGRVKQKTGEIVAHWAKRCPIECMMSGQSRGRTLKALREKVEKLSGNPDSADQAHRLRNYLKKLMLAQQLRGDRILKLPDSELRLVLNSMLEEKVTFHPDVLSNILEHKINGLLQRGKIEELLVTVKPWAAEGEAFDVLKPRLGALQLPLATRVSRFRSAFWARGMAALLMSDGDSKDGVEAACDAIVAVFSKEDALELENLSAAAMQESLICAEALRALCNMSIDSKSQSALDRIRSRQGKTDKSLITTVANSIYSNKFLEDRMQTLTRARPTLEEYGDRVSGYMTELDNIGSDAAAFQRIEVMCKDLGMIRATTASQLFDFFAEKLLATLRTTWAAVSTSSSESGLPSPAKVTSEMLKAIQTCVAEARLAFSLERSMDRIQEEAQVLVQNASGAARIERLAEVLEQSAKFDIEDVSAPAIIARVSEQIKSCVGLSLPPTTSAKVQEVTATIAAAVIEHLGSDPMKQLVQETLDLWGSLSAVAKVDGAGPLEKKLASEVNLGWIALESLKTSADSQTVEERRAGMHDFAVTMEKLTDTAKGLRREDELPVLSRLMEVADEFIQLGGNMLKEYSANLTAFRSKRLDGIITRAEEVAKGLHMGADEKPWHHNIPSTAPDAWALYCEASTTTLRTIDTRELETLLCDMNSATTSLKDALDFGKDHSPNALVDTATRVYKHMKILLHESLLLWAMLNEEEPGSLRNKVRAEVKAIRALGVKEKDVLHGSMFRKAWESVSSVPA